MTYADRFNLRGSSTLANAFLVAVEEIAMGIFSEDPATPNHAQRVAWARSVVRDRGTAQMYADMAHRLAVHVPTLQQAGEAAPDAVVRGITASLLGVFATAVSAGS